MAVKQKDFDWSLVHPWMKLAYDVGAAGAGWTEISYGSPEYHDWCEYFDSIGWAPWAFQQVVEGNKQSFTAPCKLPQWLPTNFGRQLTEALISRNKIWPYWRMPDPALKISVEDREWVKREFARLIGRMRG